MSATRGGPRAGMSGRGRQQNRGRPVSHAPTPEVTGYIGAIARAVAGACARRLVAVYLHRTAAATSSASTPGRRRRRALGRAPDDPASGQPTTTPCSDRHLGVAVRRGSTPRCGSPRQRPRRAARAQDAPAAPGHRPLCRQDPRAKSRTGTAAATAATAWGDSGRDVCDEGTADAAREQDDEFHMLWPGIGIGARRSWRDEGRPSERSHANMRRGRVRSAGRRTVSPTGEADR